MRHRTSKYRTLNGVCTDFVTPNVIRSLMMKKVIRRAKRSYQQKLFIIFSPYIYIYTQLRSVYYLQDQKYRLRIVVWDFICKKMPSIKLLLVMVKLRRKKKRYNIVNNLLVIAITCISNALCMLIQKASFSSCFNFLGSTSSSLLIIDL